MKIVVTGGSGLVGTNLKSIVNEQYTNHSFTYLNRSKNDELLQRWNEIIQGDA